MPRIDQGSRGGSARRLLADRAAVHRVPQLEVYFGTLGPWWVGTQVRRRRARRRAARADVTSWRRSRTPSLGSRYATKAPGSPRAARHRRPPSRGDRRAGGRGPDGAPDAGRTGTERFASIRESAAMRSRRWRAWSTYSTPAGKARAAPSGSCASWSTRPRPAASVRLTPPPGSAFRPRPRSATEWCRRA